MKTYAYALVKVCIQLCFSFFFYVCHNIMISNAIYKLINWRNSTTDFFKPVDRMFRNQDTS